MQGSEIREGHAENLAGSSNVPPVDHLPLLLQSFSGVSCFHLVQSRDILCKHLLLSSLKIVQVPPEKILALLSGRHV